MAQAVAGVDMSRSGGPRRKRGPSGGSERPSSADASRPSLCDTTIPLRGRVVGAAVTLAVWYGLFQPPASRAGGGEAGWVRMT